MSCLVVELIGQTLNGLAKLNRNGSRIELAPTGDRFRELSTLAVSAEGRHPSVTAQSQLVAARMPESLQAVRVWRICRVPRAAWTIRHRWGIVRSVQRCIDAKAVIAVAANGAH